LRLEFGNSISHSIQGREGCGNTWRALFTGQEIGEGLSTYRRAAAAVAQLGPDLGRGRLDLGRGTVAVRDRRRRRTDDRYARETRTREVVDGAEMEKRVIWIHVIIIFDVWRNAITIRLF